MPITTILRLDHCGQDTSSPLLEGTAETVQRVSIMAQNMPLPNYHYIVKPGIRFFCHNKVSIDHNNVIEIFY